MTNIFLDNFDQDGKTRTLEMVADMILGKEQSEKIFQRYKDMELNFNSYTKDGLTKIKEGKLWNFSEGLKPWKDYKDTTSVPIPLTHPKFKNLRSDYLSTFDTDSGGAVIGHDLPTWFNLNGSDKGRIMIVAQDPLRNPKWYSDCKDAICSSTFGLHSIEWRNNGRGGKRLYLLIKKLVEFGFGIYLTDCMKFYVRAERQKPLSPSRSLLNDYAEILKEEIRIVKPTAIIAFGKKAKNTFEQLELDISPEVLRIYMPHFSGNAQSTIKSFFADDIKTQGINKLDVETQAKLYCDKIIQKVYG